MPYIYRDYYTDLHGAEEFRAGIEYCDRMIALGDKIDTHRDASKRITRAPRRFISAVSRQDPADARRADQGARRRRAGLKAWTI